MINLIHDLMIYSILLYLLL